MVKASHRARTIVALQAIACKIGHVLDHEAGIQLGVTILTRCLVKGMVKVQVAVGAGKRLAVGAMAVTGQGKSDLLMGIVGQRGGADVGVPTLVFGMTKGAFIRVLQLAMKALVVGELVAHVGVARHTALWVRPLPRAVAPRALVFKCGVRVIAV